MLEVFNNLFMNIAEQMGLQLQNTAYSVNIKERLDFSCALFDAEGSLIANAPHMPVHLGSMSESIKTVIARNAGKMQPGDVYVLNDPYHGGTHLPDVTVVTPVFDDASTDILFYVGSRGHHADIGGVTPGSMPPFSTRIDEEGVQIDNVMLVEGGPLGPRIREAEMLALLSGGAHPSRNPQQNLADLKAQIAANEKGVQELRQMVDAVRPGRRAGLHAPRSGQRRGIGAPRHRRGSRTARSRCRWTTGRGSRSRSASMRPSAAPRSTSAAPRRNSKQLQRTDGRLHGRRAVRVPHAGRRRHPAQRRLPEAAAASSSREGSMLDPQPPASVVAGNVETSTCITNALYGALGVMAAGQCTMNNFTFGNERYQYYETISGGSGAGAWFDDAAASSGASTAPASCRPT